MATIYIEDKKISLNEPMNWKTLYRADRTVKTPFHLALKDHDILHCEEIIRIVPKKRLLAFGKWGDKEVAVKLFYEKRRAKRDAGRDAFGIDCLMQANVPTPRLLYQGHIDKGRVYILVFERIKQAVSLETLWKKREDVADIHALLRAVTIELATQHVLGILQHDLHLNNFLITDTTIYTLDGGNIEYFARPLDTQTSMTYLALFLVQFGVGIDGLQQELFDVYTKARGWLVKPSDIKTFQKNIAHQTEERMGNYKKKIFRKCSSFNRIDKINKKIIYDRQYESLAFKNLLLNPDSYIDHQTAVILKAGNSSTVAKVVINGQPLVIKRYNIKNMLHGLRRCLRTTRAKNSWQISQQLYVCGVATPKPIAYIENNFLGLRGKSYFIMDYMANDHIGDYFSEHKDDLSKCEGMAENTLALFKSMAKLRITQGDLKMTNVLVNNHKPYLIDFDGAREFISSIALRRSYKNELERFMKNWESKPDIHTLFKRLIQEGMF